MFFPYGDVNPTDRTPFINWILIAANVGIHIYVTLVLLAQADRVTIETFFFKWGLIPDQKEPLTFLTSMFLHGSFGHLIGNMLFLYITGDNIEDRFGHFWYLAIYLICGLAAALAQISANPQSTTPMIGASGAISGMMGAYVILFPRSKIKVFLLLWPFFITRLLIDAIWWIGLWILFQFAATYLEQQGPGGGGIAYWAHIGGFIAGAGIAYIANKLGFVRGGVKPGASGGSWGAGHRKNRRKRDDFWSLRKGKFIPSDQTSWGR